MNDYSFDSVYGLISCKYFYDVDNSCDSIDVRLEGVYIGEISNIDIPDLENDDEYETFEERVFDFVRTELD